MAKQKYLILISGSMRFKEEMTLLSTKLREFGNNKIIEPSDDIYYQGIGLIEKAKNHKIFEKLIENADLLLVYNKEGYIGLSSAMEIQKALDCKVPVRLLCEPEAIEFKAFCLHPEYDFKVDERNFFFSEKL